MDEFWFVLIIAIIIIFFSAASQKDTLREEAESLTSELTNGGTYSLATGGAIQEQKVDKLAKMNYNELKKVLEVESDFCVYFEDQNGNLIEVKDGVESFGSEIIELNGKPCGR